MNRSISRQPSEGDGLAALARRLNVIENMLDNISDVCTKMKIHYDGNELEKHKTSTVWDKDLEETRRLTSAMEASIPEVPDVSDCPCPSRKILQEAVLIRPRWDSSSTFNEDRKSQGLRTSPESEDKKHLWFTHCWHAKQIDRVMRFQ